MDADIPLRQYAKNTAEAKQETLQPPGAERLCGDPPA